MQPDQKIAHRENSVAMACMQFSDLSDYNWFGYYCSCTDNNSFIQFKLGARKPLVSWKHMPLSIISHKHSKVVYWGSQLYDKLD